MHKTFSLAYWKSDLAGGLVSAIVYLPFSMAWGILAFAPLGSDFVSAGVLAGLYSSIFVGLITAFFGGMPVMQSGARAANALIFSTLLVSLVNAGHIDLNQASHINSLLAIAFFTVALSGIIQVGLGWLRLGMLIKYIPFPISLGFINATGVLVIISQFPALLSLPKEESLFDILGQLSQADMGTLLFGVMTLAIIWYFSRLSKNIPAPVAGLVVATLIYQALSHAGMSGFFGDTLGYIPSELPTPDKIVGIFSSDTAVILHNSLPIILIASLSMALMGALESLLTANSLERLTKDRAEGGRILTGLGLANVVAACFGAIPGSGSPSRSIPAINAGGKTELSAIISSATILLAILIFSSVLQYIPKAAMAGMLVFVGIQIIDKWTLKNFCQLDWRVLLQRNELSNNILIILAVVFIALVFNLIVAVVSGILLAVLVFLFKISRNVIKRIYFGNQLHSMTFRHHLERKYLEESGQRIAVIELEGPIFFGSAEGIRKEVLRLVANGTEYIVLDMKNVTDIDLTGIKILQTVITELEAEGKAIVIAQVEKERRSLSKAPYQGAERRSLTQERRVWKSFSEANAFEIIDESIFFPDVDLALENCEAQILGDLCLSKENLLNVFTPDIDLFSGFTVDQIDNIRPFFKKVIHEKGTLLMREGDTGDSLALLESGLVDVTISLSGTERRRRISSLTGGTFVGETALLDGKPRSATIEVIQDVTCYVLGVSDFEQIKHTYPDIAYQLLTNISLLFASRLRFAMKMIGKS
jgi:SulP family sulfate permease